MDENSQDKSQQIIDQTCLTSQEKTKEVGVRKELMEKLLGHVIRNEKYQTTCLQPLHSLPNREKLLAQCASLK